MPSERDFPARGKIIAIQDRTVVFAPANSNYELRLETEGSLDGASVGITLDAVIRVPARKLWTVPSGGNFIEPIFGPPRKVQGRIKYLDEDRMVVQAGAPIAVALPTDPAAYDLVRGPLTVGGLVNVAVLPGATFELLTKAASAK
jgi:hypothetical protein